MSFWNNSVYTLSKKLTHYGSSGKHDRTTKENKMNTVINASRLTDRSLRKAAIVAGLGGRIMAILAPIANFGVFEKLIVPGDATITATNIMASVGLFRIGIICFLIVAILDVVVAWALYILLVPANKNLSALAAWLRVIYAGIFIFAISKLYIALQLITADGTQTMSFLKAFQSIWDKGLILFGFHLLVLGYLVFKSGYIPKWLGVFLVLAAVGYIVDGIGKTLTPDYNLNIAQFTFVGEVLLIFWLLWKGIKGFDKELASKENLNFGYSDYFFFSNTTSTKIYTLSLHVAFPI